MSVMIFVGLLSLTLAMPRWAEAADFPKKGITIVVNQAAGGGLDLTYRIFAQYLQDELKVPVIVQNTTEGGGKKGAQDVFDAKPDGHTLLANLETRNIQGEVVYKAPYKMLDFTYVAGLTKYDMMLVTRKEAPFKNLVEMKAFSQKKPLSVGTTGVGSLTHFIFLRLKEEGGLSNMEAVPFRGSAPAETAVIGGHVDATLTSVSTSTTHMEKLLLLCTFGKERSEFTPKTPTAFEQGYNIATDEIDGILAPPKTPKEIVAILYQALDKIRKKPEVQEKMRKIGRTVVFLSGEDYYKELAQTYKTVERYKEIFKE